MKLKSLTISGFKSFADQTKIDFQPGITGVVGPNGSGKSNIIEALRWVMGEQSAKGLRGDKMADVIFSGTTVRAPLNRAEVTVVFDNSDHYMQSAYSEIQLTRTLYRSGESKYQMNGQVVRLRDIQELFMDSGLGRESFSIISQGRVEHIFSAKPEDRRAIIEEVAGVYKYKQNKDRADKELVGVHDNLSRVEDILYELQGRLEPLAEQSAIAKDYLQQKQQFDQLDQVRLGLQLQTWLAEQSQLQTNLQQHQAEVDQQTAVIEAQTAQREKLQAEQTTLESAQQAVQQALLEATQNLERIIGEQKLQTERQQNHALVAQQLAERLANATATLAEAEAGRDRQAETLAAHEAELARLQAQLVQAQAHHPKETYGAVKQRLEETRVTLVETMQAVATATNEQQYVAQETQRQASQSLRLAEQLATAEAHVTELQVQQRQQAATVEAKRAELAEIKAELATRQESGQALEQTYQAARKRWYQEQDTQQHIHGRLQALKQLQENYDGYYQGVKRLMQVQQDFPGIRGVVAELMTVNPDLQKAIETALGGALQQVVVDHEQTAKQAVRYLTQGRHGRVTFLPMTTIKARQLTVDQQQTLATQPGFVGIAADLVSVDPDYRAIMQHLLGLTAIVSDMDAALPIAKRLGHRVRIVTLDGQILQAGGAITGGARAGQDNGLLKQQHEMDQLSVQATQLKASVAQLEADVHAQGQALEQATSAFKEAQQRFMTVNETVQAAQAQLQVVDAQLTQAQDQLAALTFEQRQNQADQPSATQAAGKTLAELEKRQADQQATLDRLLAEAAQLEADSEQADAAIAQLKETLAQVQTQVASAQARLIEWDEQVAREQRQHQQLQQQEADLSADQEDVQARLAQERAALEAEKETLTTTQVEQAQQEQALTAEADTALRRQQAAQKAQTALLTQHQSDVRRGGELTSQIEQAQQHLQDSYQTDYASVAANLPDAADLSQIQGQLKLLKLGLSELGTVNVGAIDEYAEVKARFDFLTQQQTDLIEARDHLQQTMAEMDEEVKTRFTATFDAIAAQFSQLFVKMFGGGKAELILTNPDDVLTTGVDIKAQPPGKKFQQLSLLSGGEKALTAISLLFAILEVRPVPFVVLDETEAALDEANVKRFATYLHAVNDKTQFIVITHRKGTMTEADVLYGVTMQEPGVSTMVSVDLAKMEARPAATARNEEMNGII